MLIKEKGLMFERSLINPLHSFDLYVSFHPSLVFHASQPPSDLPKSLLLCLKVTSTHQPLQAALMSKPRVSSKNSLPCPFLPQSNPTKTSIQPFIS